MKKFYNAPEIDFILLVTEDVLTTSTGDVNDELDYPTVNDPYGNN